MGGNWKIFILPFLRPFSLSHVSLIPGWRGGRVCRWGSSVVNSLLKASYIPIGSVTSFFFSFSKISGPWNQVQGEVGCRPRRSGYWIWCDFDEWASSAEGKRVLVSTPPVFNWNTLLSNRHTTEKHSKWIWSSLLEAEISSLYKENIGFSWHENPLDSKQRVYTF